MNRPNLLTRTALCSAVFAAAFALATPASAQTGTTPGENDNPCVDESGNPLPECVDSQGQVTTTSADEGIVVVGSRIRRNQFNTADPIQIVTRDEATQAGFNSTAEILQSTAVTGGTDQINDAYGGFVVNGGPGVNTISLRGLGTTRTLVLLNGRRIAPAGSRGGVGAADLNVLPNAIIDRIEVLNTGASSIYGSDAVAGVINIVTRNNVDGLTLEASHVVPQHGGGTTYRYALVGGFEADRFNVSGSLEYFKRDRIRIGDREWARCPTGLYGTNGTDFGADDFINPRTGEVQCFPLENGGVTVNTIGLPNVAGNLVQLAPGIPAGYTGVCNRFRPLAGAGGAVPGYECVGGGSLSTNLRDTFAPSLLQEDLISPVELYTGYLQATYDSSILGNAQFYVDLLVNRRNSEQDGQRQFTIDYPTGSPLLPANLRNGIFLGPQANAPYNTAVRVFADYGIYNNRQTVDFVRFQGGVRGELPFNWRYDFYAGKSWSDADYTTDLILTDRLVQSLQVVQNADGSFRCANTLNQCVPAPALTADVVGGQFPRNWLDFVVVPVTGHTSYEESVFNLTVDGPLFNIWGGEVQVALGVERREARIDDTPDVNSQRGNLFGFTSSSITRGSDSVWEAFGEVEVPLIRESFIHNLTLNGSGRYTEYESYGGQWTYKIGGILAPIRELAFRASYGTSYRAPALFEQFQGATSGFLANTTDPCNDLASVTNPLIRDRCLAEGLPADFRQNSSVQVVGLGGAEAGLSAETSDALTFGGVFQPEFGPSFGSLSIAVDYFDVKIDNGVAQLGAATVLSQCYANPQRTTCDTPLITRTPYTGPGTGTLTVIQSYVNISDARAEGIDYTLRYARDLGPGRIRLGAQMTQFLTRYSRTLPTNAILNVIGLIENPEWTGTFDVAYSQGPWNFRWGVEWVGATDAQDYAEPFGYDPNVYLLRTDDYFEHAVSVRYETERFGITFGVRNLFDTDPPVISAEYTNQIGNAPLYSGYDYFGRSFFVNTRFSF